MNDPVHSTMNPVPPVAFLGVVERVAHVSDANTHLKKYNIIGLKNIVLSHIFPINLSWFGFMFAVYDVKPNDNIKIRIVNQVGFEVGHIDIAMTATAAPTSLADLALRVDGQLLPIPDAGWIVMILPSGVANMLITEPNLYKVLLTMDEQDIQIGFIDFILLDPVPLTPDRIAAIRSDPTATKAIRVMISCKCGDAIKIYTGLDRLPNLEAEAFVWHENLPDSFTCRCGTSVIPLGIMRKNLPSLLGSPSRQDGQLSYVPLYEKSALTNIRMNFMALLQKNAPEETFQKFLEENTILLHLFSPDRIFFKAPILSLHKTDFALVNHQRELLLIELERPDTRLIKKDGGVHSELQHAFDQTRDWLHTADEHRAAVLECIGVQQAHVGAVHTVIIAGRDLNHDPEHLRKLKGADFGRTRLLTYDDLLADLDALIRTFDNL